MSKETVQIENFDTAPANALLSLRAAGVIAERSRASLYRDNKEGRLPFLKVGCSTRIRVGDLRRFLCGEAVHSSKDNTASASNQELAIGMTQSQGVTMRDYFAAKAINPLITGFDTPEDVTVFKLMSDRLEGNGFIEDDIAEFAYRIADAMLKARDA